MYKYSLESDGGGDDSASACDIYCTLILPEELREAYKCQAMTFTGRQDNSRSAKPEVLQMWWDMTPIMAVFPFTGCCLVMARGLEQFREAMGYAVQGHPRRTGHSGEFGLNVIHLEQELASHSSIFAKKTP